MDQQPSSEQLLALTLQGRPVPDMADAIWARIEAQLDIDMPTDEGGSNDPGPSSPRGSGIIGWGLSVVIVALVSAFLLFKNKPKTNPSTQSTPVPTEQINQPFQQTNSPPATNARGIKPTSLPPAAKENTDVTIDTLEQPQITLLPKQADSVKAAPPQPVAITPSAKDTTPLKKKRGVSGITDDDYRIVPEKDGQ